MPENNQANSLKINLPACTLECDLKAARFSGVIPMSECVLGALYSGFLELCYMFVLVFL